LVFPLEHRRLDDYQKDVFEVVEGMGLKRGLQKKVQQNRKTQI
jgi:hypothetical protein